MNAEEAEALWRQAQSELANSSPEEAVIPLETYLSEFREDPEVRLELARARFLAGDLPQAQTLLEELLLEKSPPEEAYLNLAALHGEKGDAAKEAEYLRKIPESERLEVLFNLGLAAFEKRDEGSLRRLRRLFEQHGKDDSGLLWLDAFGAELREDWEAAEENYRALTDQGEPAAAHCAGRMSLNRKQPAGALECFQRAHRSDPTCWRSVLGLALAYEDLKDFEKAKKNYLVALDLTPAGEETPVLRFGEFLLRASQASEAADLLEAAMARSPENRDLVLMAARAFFSAGRHELAIEAYTRVLEEDPQHFRATYNRAFSCEHLGRMEEAISGYSRGLSLRPGHYKSLNKLARIHLKQGNPQEAFRFAERSIEQEGEENAEGFLMQAQALKNLLRFEEAVKAYQGAAKRGGNSSAVWREQSFCLRRLGKHQEAKECSKKA